jgi:DNA-binding response OmpR family regulator
MTQDPRTVLVVEDDWSTLTFLADNLTADGYEVHAAETAAEAVRIAETKYPDIALVDLELPDLDGLKLIARIRAADGIASRANPHLPVIIVSGRTDELDRLRGFERGADDYVVKPFSYPELRLRMRVVLQRSEHRTGQGRMRVGALEVDPVSREVRLRGRRLGLSAKEFALVRTLAADPTRVFSKDELLRSIWGFRNLGTSRTLDSHACRLRRKLGAEGDSFVVNVWGIGYRLVDGPDADAEPTAVAALASDPASALSPSPDVTRRAHR